MLTVKHKAGDEDPYKTMAARNCLILLLLILFPRSGLTFDPQLGATVQQAKGSRFCLGCHDGTIAPNVVNTWQPFGGLAPPNFCLQSSHPIEIDYNLARLRSKGRLRHPSSFDPAVKLESGMVGCTSCHSPDSQLQKKLVMINSGSRLCFVCHNL
jgi:predicted CXXCH cytochrome family protein